MRHVQLCFVADHSWHRYQTIYELLREGDGGRQDAQNGMKTSRKLDGEGVPGIIARGWHAVQVGQSNEGDGYATSQSQKTG